MKTTRMKRREILKYTAYMTGAAVSLPLMSTLLTGCKTDDIAKAKDFKLSFFNKEEFNFVEKMVDIILPATDSPSASAVGVHKMIDTMVGTTYKKEDVDMYRKKFNALKKYLNAISDENAFDYGLEKTIQGKNFLEFNQDEKIKVLKSLDASKENNEARDAYLNLKQQTISYYLSSEEIGTNFLNYLPVPGEYKGCIELSEVGGKAWAL